MMKKIIFTFFLILLINVDVYSMELRTSSSSLKARNYTDWILEKVFVDYDNEILSSVNYNIIITSDCELDEILIIPEIFGSINEFKEIKSLGDVEVIINIINLSNNNYKYINNSFDIVPYTYDYFNDSNFYNIFNYRYYKYFYKEVLEMGINNNYYGISNYKLDKFINEVFNNKFQRVDDISSLKFRVRINKDRYKKIYNNYGYLGKVSFSLKKIDKLEVIPVTGI